MNAPAHGYFLLLVVLCVVAAGCRNSDIGGPCAVPTECANVVPTNANLVCEPVADCDGLVCLSYRVDGNPDRAPFCTADCTPDPTCEANDPAACAAAGGDVTGGCPRDLNGNPALCVAVLENVNAMEPTNCTVTAGGSTTNARCTCLPCCLVDATLCANPSDCQ